MATWPIMFLGLCFILSCQKQPDLSPQLAPQQSQITALQKRCDSLAAALTKANNTVLNLSAEILSLTNSQSSQKLSIDSIKSEIAGILTSIASLNTQVTQENTQLTNLTAQLATTNANVAAIDAQITTIDSQISTLNNQYSALLTQLNSILSQLSIPTTLTNGLIAYFPFTGNTQDASGNGNNGVLNGATLTTDRFGNANSAYNFINTGFGTLGDQIYIPYNSSFNVNNLSISLWVNPSTINTGGAMINRYEGGYANSNSQAWQFLLVNNNPYAVLDAASTTNSQNVDSLSTHSIIPMNTWTHLVFTFNGSTLLIYTNGNLTASLNQTFVLNTNSTSGISIGQSRQANGNWDNFNGDLDEIRVYNRVLTQTEITYLATH